MNFGTYFETYFEMYFDRSRAALLTLLSQPAAVASVVVLSGINAALWLLVFRRTGFPTALASLLLLPPLNFVLPLYFAFARWPGHQIALPNGMNRRITNKPVRRRTQPQPRRKEAPIYEALDHRWPMRLASDGLPRFRIPMESSVSPLEQYRSQHMGI